MPAHPMPTYIPVSIDNCLVDEEFDMFDISAPYNQKRNIGRPALVCKDATDWDEFDEEMSSM